jgi:hypothetical protein
MNLLKSYTLIKIFFLSLLKERLFFDFILKNIKLSNSQLFQDLFVFYYSGFKKNGFFIEIGVGNGKDISNTLLLEKKKNWNGLLCEADSRMIKEIKINRKCGLVALPVTSVCRKKIKFFENLKDPYQSSSFSFNLKNNYRIKYINSICINHLLEKKNSPKNIDYMSIDTEGNEYDIIKNINFNKWKIKIITIEHNFDNNNRKKIYKLLTKNNYKRVHSGISYMDDWYVLKSN